MTHSSHDQFREAIQKAEAKAAVRKQESLERSLKRAKSIRIKVKEQTRDDKEPTTAALQSWTAAEYLAAFNKVAESHIKRYVDAKKLISLVAVQEFLATLDEHDACPRSKLLIIREAAKRLLRYKKQYFVKAVPQPWMLRTFAVEIIEDLKGLLYSQASLRYLYTEEVRVDMLDIAYGDREWIVSWEGRQARLPLSHLNQVTNPFLLAKLDKPPKQETTPDDEDYDNWES